MSKTLFHVETGRGQAPAMAFLHGWTCDHRAMLPIAERFEKDYRVLNIDLLGHGRSPKSAQGYGIDVQARAVRGLLRGLEARNAILVGHSMGAQVALELARQPGIAAAILLDPAVITGSAKWRDWGAGMKRQLARVDIPQMIAAFARRQFLWPRAPRQVEDLVAMMTAIDPEVARRAWDGLLEWDGPAALAAAQCPILAIAASVPANQPQDLARLNRRVMTAQAAGTGHMLQYEAPEQLELMMRRFIQIAVVSQPALP